MITWNFREWLLQMEMGVPQPGAPDPSLTMANQAIKNSMATIDPSKPLATQARQKLADVAKTHPDPMKIASLDQAAPATPGQKMMGKK
jgi:hypothetical protein